jgi:hypothetical protein
MKGPTMRRLPAATVTTAVTALLSAAALGAGAAAAQASAYVVSNDPISSGPISTAEVSTAGSPGGFTFHMLGGLHLKRVETTTGETHVGYLLCTSTASGGAAPVIHGAGGVKDATSACEELAAAHGNLDALSVHPTWLPPAIVAPVDVKVAGTWEGAKVAWSHEYQNGGWLTKATGDVFVF